MTYIVIVSVIFGILMISNPVNALEFKCVGGKDINNLTDKQLTDWLDKVLSKVKGPWDESKGMSVSETCKKKGFWDLLVNKLNHYNSVVKNFINDPNPGVRKYYQKDLRDTTKSVYYLLNEMYRSNCFCRWDKKQLEDLIKDMHKLKGCCKWKLPIIGEITSEFGWRIDPITGETRHHDGMDISAIEGTPIHPTRSGTVVDINSVDSYGGGYGYFVEVDHGNGLTSFYAHMSSVGKIYIRQNIDSTTIIGYVGNTGKSTGNHLHLEIRENGNPVNPRNYMGKSC